MKNMDRGEIWGRNQWADGTFPTRPRPALFWGRSGQCLSAAEAG